MKNDSEFPVWTVEFFPAKWIGLFGVFWMICSGDISLSFAWV